MTPDAWPRRASTPTPAAPTARRAASKAACSPAVSHASPKAPVQQRCLLQKHFAVDVNIGDLAFGWPTGGTVDLGGVKQNPPRQSAPLMASASSARASLRSEAHRSKASRFSKRRAEKIEKAGGTCSSSLPEREEAGAEQDEAPAQPKYKLEAKVGYDVPRC